MASFSPQNKKMVVVSLDTSDTINLNHLDVIPLQLNFGSLDKSIVNVDIEKHGGILPKTGKKNKHKACQDDDGDESEDNDEEGEDDEDNNNNTNDQNRNRCLSQTNKRKVMIGPYQYVDASVLESKSNNTAKKGRIKKKGKKGTKSIHQSCNGSQKYNQSSHSFSKTSQSIQCKFQYPQNKETGGKATEPRGTASSSFDRYGRLTRVTANYTEDFKAVKLCKKMEQLRRRKAANQSNNGSLENVSNRPQLGQQRNKPYKTAAFSTATATAETSCNEEDDQEKVSEEILKQIRGLGLKEGMENTVAFSKLTQALKDLQANWEEDLVTDESKCAEGGGEGANCQKYNNNKSNFNGMKSQDSKKLGPFTCHRRSNSNSALLNSLNDIVANHNNKNCDLTDLVTIRSRSRIHTNNYNNNEIPVKINNNNITCMKMNLEEVNGTSARQSDALICSKETPRDYFRSSNLTPSEIMDLMADVTKGEKNNENNNNRNSQNDYHHPNPLSIPALSKQKTADIWNWVSSKYSGIQDSSLSLSKDEPPSDCVTRATTVGHMMSSLSVNQLSVSGIQDDQKTYSVCSPMDRDGIQDDQRTFSFCSLKDRDGSFITDGDGDEPSPLRKMILRHDHLSQCQSQTQNQSQIQSQNKNHNLKNTGGDQLDEFIGEFLKTLTKDGGNGATKRMSELDHKVSDDKANKDKDNGATQNATIEQFDKGHQHQPHALDRQTSSQCSSDDDQSTDCSCSCSCSCSSNNMPIPPMSSGCHVDWTPPCTSTWNLSPLYEAAGTTSSECITNDDTPKHGKRRESCQRNNKDVQSEFSITPAVHSRASMRDVHSGDEVLTKGSSSSSSNSDLENEEAEKTIKELAKIRKRVMDLSEISDQRLLELLGQCSPEEGHKNTMAFVDKLVENIAATPVPSAKNGVEVYVSDKEGQTEDPSKIVEKEQHSKSKVFVCDCAKKISRTQTDSPKKVKSNEAEGLSKAKSSGTLCKKCSSAEMKKAKRKKKKKGKKKEDGDSSGEEKENKVKVKKPKAITLFKKPTDTTDKEDNGEVNGTAAGDNSELPIQKLRNSLPRTPGGRFAFTSKEAELAIAEYVKAELAASLELGEAKLKPGKLRDVLITVSNELDKKHSNSNSEKDKDRDRDKEKGSKGTNTLVSNYSSTSHHHHHHQHNCSSKSNIPAKRKIPSQPVLRRPLINRTPQSNPRPPNCGIIPKQSNRINFIRYQQQSFAAMLNISRARMNSRRPGYHRPLDRTVPGITRPPQHPSDVFDLARRKEALNARIRPNNRNAVTVVFGNSHNNNHNSLTNTNFNSRHTNNA